MDTKYFLFSCSYYTFHFSRTSTREHCAVHRVGFSRTYLAYFFVSLTTWTQTLTYLFKKVLTKTSLHYAFLQNRHYWEKKPLNHLHYPPNTEIGCIQMPPHKPQSSDYSQWPWLPSHGHHHTWSTPNKHLVPHQLPKKCTKVFECTKFKKPFYEHVSLPLLSILVPRSTIVPLPNSTQFSL